MRKFEKDALYFTYDWHTGPSERRENPIINRDNGHDILHFVNWFYTTHQLSSTNSIERIEGLIQKAPKSALTQRDLCTWIRAHWNSYCPVSSMASVKKLIEFSLS